MFGLNEIGGPLFLRELNYIQVQVSDNWVLSF